MRIAIIDEIHSYRERSGIGRYSFELFRNLKKINKDVNLLGLTDEKKENFKDKEIKIIPPRFNLPIFKRTINWQLYYPNAIPDGYDIYHTTNPFLIKTVAGRSNSIVTIHDMGLFELPEHMFLKTFLPYSFFSWLHRKVLKDNIHSVRKIITISEYTKKKVIEILRVKDNDVKVIYLGVSSVFKPMDKMECRKKLKLPLDRKIILYVGAEQPKKNVGVLIKSITEVKKKIKELLLVRIGICSQITRKMIRELNLNNYIRYFNDLRDDLLPLFYNAADVFVFPSLYEGFGLPLLEAMACNVPVIAADATCFPEILGDAGMLFNPMDIKELSEALTKVLEDKNLTDDLVKKGQERVRNFRWQNTAEQTLKLYREVYE